MGYDFEDCGKCSDVSKKVVGFYDRKDGGGVIYGCSNVACEMREREQKAEQEAELNKLRVELENRRYGVHPEAMRAKRRKAGLTLGRAAEIAKVRPSEYSDWESGRKVIPQDKYSEMMFKLETERISND